jgi:hypothetical protein
MSTSVLLGVAFRGFHPNDHWISPNDEGISTNGRSAIAQRF